jgi:hypothetical protein
MSDITTFFPAAGGGGGGNIGLATTPYELFFGKAYYNIPNFKAAAAISSLASETAFYTQLGSSNYGYDTPGLAAQASNVYQTLTDITGSTKGGVFRGALSPGFESGAAKSFKWRITVDGTEYILEATYPAGASAEGTQKSVLGNFIDVSPAESTSPTNGAMVNYMNPINTQLNFNSTYSYDFIENSFQGNSGNNRMMIPVNIMQMGGVAFKESLKVEFAASNPTSGSAGSAISNCLSMVTEY